MHGDEHTPDADKRPAPAREDEGQFSEGQEQLPEDAGDKHHERRFSEGQEAGSKDD